MPESQAERLREEAAEKGAPDPVQEDGERIDRVEEGIDEEEARERQK